MATTNEFKQWGEDYEPGLLTTWQNDSFVYAGLFNQATVEGDEWQVDFGGTLEMQALADEFIEQDSQHIDYEAVKGKASPFYVQTSWRRSDIDRMRPSTGNPIPFTISEHMKAYRRKKSSIVRDNMAAVVTARYFGATSFSDQALDSAQQIGSGAAITVANIRAISSLFERRFGLLNGETPYLAISREEKDTLLAIEELINKDYNLGAAPTITGEFGNVVEGVQLVMDQGLNTSGGARTCLAWIPSSVTYLTQRAPLARFGERDDKHYSFQAYMSADEGFVRHRKYGVMTLSTVANYTI